VYLRVYNGGIPGCEREVYNGGIPGCEREREITGGRRRRDTTIPPFHPG